MMTATLRAEGAASGSVTAQCELSEGVHGRTMHITPTHPVQFSVDYPDRSLNRATTAFRAVVALPILAVLAAVSGGVWQWSSDSGLADAGAGGVLFFGA